MKRFSLSVLAAALLLCPVASSATVVGAAAVFAQTTDEPERAAPPDGNTALESGAEPALAAPPADLPEDGPALAPILETEPTSANPYYGPGWSGPVNHAPVPACPAWYSPHTVCTP